jgi:hypothetical protein
MISKVPGSQRLVFFRLPVCFKLLRTNFRLLKDKILDTILSSSVADYSEAMGELLTAVVYQSRGGCNSEPEQLEQRVTF